MINQVYERLLRHLIDVDGKLSNDYSLVLFNSELNPSFFTSYDAKSNKFVETPYSILWTLLTDYYSTYKKPPSDMTLLAEIQSNNRLSSAQKQDIQTLIVAIRFYSEEGTQLDFLRAKIREVFVKTRQMAICTHGIQIGQDDPVKGSQFIQEELSNLLARATVSEAHEEKSKFLWQFMEVQLSNFNKYGSLMHGAVPYGFPDWDQAMGGLYPGELVIICGRPGVGKSFISSEIAYSSAIERNLKVVFANREMLDAQIANRFISRQTRIPSKKLRFLEALTNDERELVAAAMEDFVATKNKNLLFIPPAKCVNVSMVRREIELAFGATKPDLIIVDYLNDLEAEGYRLEGHEKIGHITQALKNLAVYFQCPVISPTQPSSAGLETTDPTMKDMGYKVITHKADTIFFCTEDPEHRYVAPMIETAIGEPGIINVKVIKGRNGGIPRYPFRVSVEFATSSVCSAASMERAVDPIAMTLRDE